MKEKYVYKYDVIRVLLTMLVVAGHVNYYITGNNYGGIDILNQMLDKSI